MNENEMWEAVKSSNENYDGLFFYAVKTTGIFCRPSCKSKLPKRENICYFESAQQARNAGFRPCKRCRSDLLEFHPMQEIAEEVRKKLVEIVTTHQQISLENIGLTKRRSSEIFKLEYGITPKEYMDEMRIHKAKQMLKNTDNKIITIAYDVGFSSLSSFNRFFKGKMGQTPSEYRKMTKERRNEK